MTSGLKDWAKWLLFFSSYFPLYFIIGAKARTTSFDLVLFKTPIYSIFGYDVSSVSLMSAVFGVIVIGFFVAVIYLRRGVNGQPKPVGEPTERNELLVSYIFVHIVPFAFIDYTSTLNFLAFLVLFLSIGIVQVRSSYLHINPLLAAMRYEVYDIEDADTHGQVLLVKTYEEASNENSEIAAVELSNNVYITTDR
jgi:hypothetical protein